MRKLFLCILLLVVLCSVPSSLHISIKNSSKIQENGENPQRRTEIEDRNTNGTETMDLSLYYRYKDTNYLGCEKAIIDLSREETIATLTINELISGPSVSNPYLVGLFPDGTRLIDVKIDGSTAHVTLSSEFLGMPNGAPADWEENSYWVQEAALRRRLAFQSIVLSLTDGAQCQRVQLYTAEDDDSVPERLPLYLLNEQETDYTLRLAACGRDETVLITPTVVVETVFHSWLEQKWEAAYPFIWFDESLNDEQSFRKVVYQISVSLLTYEFSNGSVSLDGQTATLVMNGRILDMNGEQTDIIRESIPIYRIKDNWMISYKTLLSLMIRD